MACVLVGLVIVPCLGLIGLSAKGGPGLLDWWGATDWRNSLTWRAPKTRLPSTANAADGIKHYTAMCIQCHGAPGVAAAEWAQQMQPPPPKLWERPTQKLGPGKLYYTVSQGVRMTGMPAFLGGDHRPQDIWNIVAFVMKLDNLTAAEKMQLEKAAPSKERDDYHAHGHVSTAHALGKQPSLR